MVAITYECPNCHWHHGHAEGCPSYYEAPAPETAGEWRVVHDGPSRPMIETDDNRLLSISQFQNGGWQPYAQEEDDCAAIVADHHAAQVRAGLVEALRNEWEALRVWLSNKNNVSDEVREGMLISRTKLHAALKAAGGGE